MKIEALDQNANYFEKVITFGEIHKITAIEEIDKSLNEPDDETQYVNVSLADGTIILGLNKETFVKMGQ
jgi:hypothetical protein